MIEKERKIEIETERKKREKEREGKRESERTSERKRRVERENERTLMPLKTRYVEELMHVKSVEEPNLPGSVEGKLGVRGARLGVILVT
ncbi:hypothetical protein TNCV_1987371 [Trichonephila clavipes]|nr:hypothetical protein TNCV_1987371 [Trichonephila clavipes]